MTFLLLAGNLIAWLIWREWWSALGAVSALVGLVVGWRVNVITRRLEGYR